MRAARVHLPPFLTVDDMFSIMFGRPRCSSLGPARTLLGALQASLLTNVLGTAAAVLRGKSMS